MERRIANINRTLERNNLSYRATSRMYMSFVQIRFDARIERAIFLRRPARNISRRFSVDQPSGFNVQNVGEPIDHPPAIASTSTSNDVISSTLPAGPSRRKRRANSVDSAERRYIAPEGLRATIENIRRTLGECFFWFFLYRFLLSIS